MSGDSFSGENVTSDESRASVNFDQNERRTLAQIRDEQMRALICEDREIERRMEMLTVIQNDPLSPSAPMLAAPSHGYNTRFQTAVLNGVTNFPQYYEPDSDYDHDYEEFGAEFDFHAIQYTPC